MEKQLNQAKTEPVVLCKNCSKPPRLVVCGVGSYVRCPWCNTGTYMQSRKEDAIQLWNQMMREEEKNMSHTDNNIVNIKIERLYPHPDNPRKDVGDVSELAESIRKNGIMQNLTIMPVSALTTDPDEQPETDELSLTSDFYVLIGHRRLAASKLAGLSEVPCKIVSKISKKEQIGIMLEENMQRNDLTIYEQAQGFQMMLDLGETEDSIAEKTGFSKTTIRHRLNIAKLDQEVLQKKQDSDSFQLSLKDLYELEKVSDLKTRNKILREATDSRSLAWKARQAAEEEVRDKRQKKIIELLKKLGIKKAPEKAENEQYTGKWKIVEEISLEKDIPKRIRIPEGEVELFYLPYYRVVRVITERKSEKKELTPEELKRKELEKNKKKIRAMMKEMNIRRREFILEIISGKIEPVKEVEEIQAAVWNALAECGVYIQVSTMRHFFTNKSDYDCTAEEKTEADTKVKACSLLHQMFLVMDYAMTNIGDIFDWQGYFKADIGLRLSKGYQILKRYGWSFASEEEKQLLNGQHELYIRKNQEGE